MKTEIRFEVAKVGERREDMLDALTAAEPSPSFSSYEAAEKYIVGIISLMPDEDSLMENLPRYSINKVFVPSLQDGR